MDWKNMFRKHPSYQVSNEKPNDVEILILCSLLETDSGVRMHAKKSHPITESVIP